MWLMACALLVWRGHVEHIESVDVAVVFGTTVHEDGSVSQPLRARLDRAVELYQAGWFRHVLVSGGLGREGQQEAVVMKQYLVSRGVPTEAVWADTQGNDTFRTAQHTVSLMKQQGWQSVMVISQYFHVPRCQLALERFGVQRVLRAHARLYAARDVYSVPREVAGILYYFMRSYAQTER